MNEKLARALVHERSGGDCELRIPGACLGRATNFHHRRKRSQRGPWSPSNGLALCGDGTRGCHGVITNTRSEYYAAGWIVHSWDDWASTPVLMWSSLGHDYVLLGEGGEVTLAPWPQQVTEHPDDVVLENAVRELGGVA